jgi:hypothetical protein
MANVLAKPEYIRCAMRTRYIFSISYYLIWPNFWHPCGKVNLPLRWKENYVRKSNPEPFKCILKVQTRRESYRIVSYRTPMGTIRIVVSPMLGKMHLKVSVFLPLKISGTQQSPDKQGRVARLAISVQVVLRFGLSQNPRAQACLTILRWPKLHWECPEHSLKESKIRPRLLWVTWVWFLMNLPSSKVRLKLSLALRQKYLRFPCLKSTFWFVQNHKSWLKPGHILWLLKLERHRVVANQFISMNQGKLEISIVIKWQLWILKVIIWLRINWEPWKPFSKQRAKQ